MSNGGGVELQRWSAFGHAQHCIVLVQRDCIILHYAVLYYTNIEYMIYNDNVYDARLYYTTLHYTIL